MAKLKNNVVGTEFGELHNRYKTASKEVELNTSRGCARRQTLWGGAYEAVMASIKGKRSPPITNFGLLRDIISTFFPQLSSEPNVSIVQVDLDQIP